MNAIFDVRFVTSLCKQTRCGYRRIVLYRYSALLLKRGQCSPKYSQKTAHSSPVNTISQKTVKISVTKYIWKLRLWNKSSHRKVIIHGNSEFEQKSKICYKFCNLYYPFPIVKSHKIRQLLCCVFHEIVSTILFLGTPLGQYQLQLIYKISPACNNDFALVPKLDIVWTNGYLWSLWRIWSEYTFLKSCRPFSLTAWNMRIRQRERMLVFWNKLWYLVNNFYLFSFDPDLSRVTSVLHTSDRYVSARKT